MNASRLTEKGIEIGARTAGMLGFGPRLFESALQRPTPAAGPALIHFVCKGNIHRSAYAAASCKLRLFDKKLDGFRTSSSGTYTESGKPADAGAVLVAWKHGVALNEHQTATIDAAELKKAWLIVTLDRHNHRSVRERFPAEGAKCLLLGALLLDEGEGPYIRDPYGKPEAIVEEVFTIIDRAVEKLVQRLSALRFRSETDITQPSEG